MSEPSQSDTEPTVGTDGAGSAARVPPPPPPAPEPKRDSQIPKHLASASKTAGRQLLRPRVRVALIGIAFLAVAWWWVDGSVGTILTVAGVLMLLVSWLGSRMEGRFAIEWGSEGTKVEFGNAIAPAPEPFRAPAQPTLNPARASAPATKGLAAVPTVRSAAHADVEGEAHTVEIDVDELQALIAAAEKSESARRRA